MSPSQRLDIFPEQKTKPGFFFAVASCLKQKQAIEQRKPKPLADMPLYCVHDGILIRIHSNPYITG